MTGRVVVLTRDPVPGRVKTRLVPAVGDVGAARLHAAFALHTVEVAARSGLPVEVHLDGDRSGTFAAALCAAGAGAVRAQATGDLGARIAAAAVGAERAVVIGTDCVLFHPEDLAAAAEAPEDLVLGPADDGGYWLISLREAAGSPLLADMPWSTPDVAAITLQRAARAHLSVRLVAGYPDIDEPADLAALLADPRCPPHLRALLRG